MSQEEKSDCSKIRGRQTCRTVMVPQYTAFQMFGVHLTWLTPMRMNQPEKLEIQFDCAPRSFIATVGPLSNGKSILSSILQLRLFSDDFIFLPSNIVNFKASDYFKTNHAGEKTIEVRAKSTGAKKILAKFYVLTEEGTICPEVRLEYPPERFVRLNLEVLPESTIWGMKREMVHQVKRATALIGMTLLILLIGMFLPFTRRRTSRFN